MANAITSLEEVLAYKNDEVIHRFAEDFSFSYADSEKIFSETKKWLWLCAHQSKVHPDHPPLNLFREAVAIDSMWHTFLLFTKDYKNFCDQYLGTFVDHVPQTKAEKTAALEEKKLNPETFRSHRLGKLRETYSYIYDHLGAETLRLWCEKLPVKEFF